MLTNHEESMSEHLTAIDPLFLDELMYRSYAWNRQQSPNTTPAQWGTLFAHVEALERRYQQEGIPHTTLEHTR